MSAADHGPAGHPLTREQVLDEVDFLAKAEHALVVECLSVCYALGYDLGASVMVTFWLGRVSKSGTAPSV